jgi:hypothetical protein
MAGNRSLLKWYLWHLHWCNCCSISDINTSDYGISRTCHLISKDYCSVDLGLIYCVCRENIGLIGFTRVGSRRVVQTAAIFMFFFSIFGEYIIHSWH